MQMNISFTSKEAIQLNKNIFECIYFSALEESMKLSKIYGPYDSFKGSPTSKGILQFDMWNTTPTFYSIE